MFEKFDACPSKGFDQSHSRLNFIFTVTYPKSSFRWSILTDHQTPLWDYLWRESYGAYSFHIFRIWNGTKYAIYTQWFMIFTPGNTSFPVLQPLGPTWLLPQEWTIPIPFFDSIRTRSWLQAKYLLSLSSGVRTQPSSAAISSIYLYTHFFILWYSNSRLLLLAPL